MISVIGFRIIHWKRKNKVGGIGDKTKLSMG